MRPSHHGRQKRKLPITVTFFLAKGQIIDWQSATLLVLIDFCPVQSEFLTWSYFTKTSYILPEIIIQYQI